jgi:hypothetical protein
VEKSAAEVTTAVFDEARHRDPECRRRWVVLVDGDRHQIARIRAEAKRRGMSKDVTLVVDFIHVLEYLWKAAWCFFEQGGKEAERWITERAFAVLQGHSSDVGAGIRRSATLRNLPADKRVGADDCADYLIAKQTMLRYAFGTACPSPPASSRAPAVISSSTAWTSPERAGACAEPRPSSACALFAPAGTR